MSLVNFVKTLILMSHRMSLLSKLNSSKKILTLLVQINY